MHLSRLIAENFRIFGSPQEGNHLSLALLPGLNVLAGENDSGKTAVVDAIRILLGTTSDEWYTFDREDFHDLQGEPQSPLSIACEFSGLTDAEGGAFLEWLGVRGAGDTAEPVLRITLTATLKKDAERRSRWDRDIDVRVTAGLDAVGLRMENETRSLLRATYLKPLRDAERELSPGKHSRLSQILLSHPEIARRATPEARTSLEQIMDEADDKIQKDPEVQKAREEIQERYLSKMLLRNASLAAKIGLKQADLRHILERMDLLLVPKGGGRLAPQSNASAKRRDLPVGLGHDNVLFMAAELLLAGQRTTPALPLVLIEEPEAHLHPQLQATVMVLVQELCTNPAQGTDPLQVIVTTHSPHLAAGVDLERLVLMRAGMAYPMGRNYTKLTPSDYNFLRRFLDATKANLFFARGVLLVEGYGEQLLLPTLARLIGRPLTEYGVSIVNVGHRGLFRYSRIFQRRAGQDVGIRVGCVVDSDVKSGWRTDNHGAASDVDPARVATRQRAIRRMYEGPPVQAFPSTQWTLEYDIALTGLAKFVLASIRLCGTTRSADATARAKAIASAEAEIAAWQGQGFSKERVAWLVYSKLASKKSKAETAEILAQMLDDEVAAKRLDGERLRRQLPKYLVSAIDYVTADGIQSADASG